MGLTSFWAIFSQTHLVTLAGLNKVTALDGRSDWKKVL
jgi:hypothetical protein